MRNKRDNRRYYLNRMIRKKGIRYSPKDYTIYWGYDSKIDNSHVAMLQKEYNYSIQIEIQ